MLLNYSEHSGYKGVIPCASILNDLIPRTRFWPVFYRKTIRVKEPGELGNYFFCKEDALTSSLNIANALKQLVLVMSVFSVECDLDSGYHVYPAMKCYRKWAKFDWCDNYRLLNGPIMKKLVEKKYILNLCFFLFERK